MKNLCVYKRRRTSRYAKKYNRNGMTNYRRMVMYPPANYGRVPRVWSSGFANSMP